MGVFIFRQLALALLSACCLSFLAFLLTQKTADFDALARIDGGAQLSDVQVDQWLTQRGYDQPIILRYGAWLGVLPGFRGETEDGRTVGPCIGAGIHPDDAPARCGVVQGDWGYSTRFDDDVSTVMVESLTVSAPLWIATLVLCAVLHLAWGSIGIRRAEGLAHAALEQRLVWSIFATLTRAPLVFSGLVVGEVLLNQPGFGLVMVEAARSGDTALMLACAVVAILLVLAARLFANVAFALTTQRLRVV